VLTSGISAFHLKTLDCVNIRPILSGKQFVKVVGGLGGIAKYPRIFITQVTNDHITDFGSVRERVFFQAHAIESGVDYRHNNYLLFYSIFYLAVVCLGAAIVAEVLTAVGRFERAPTPWAFPDFVFPRLRAACFVADNVIDNQDFTAGTRHGSIFSHCFNPPV
jgi:hypothetical protein